MLRREQAMDIPQVQQVIIARGNRQRDIAIDGGGHMIAIAHIQIFQKRVQPSGRAQQVGRPVAHPFAMQR